MKPLLALTLTVLVFLQAPATAELLTNPGLDDPPDHETDLATGWTLVEPDVDATGSPVNSATFATFGNHNVGGTRGLWFRSFEGGLGGDEPFDVDATLYQDVAGTAGAAYTLSAWFRYEANFPGTDPLAVTDMFLLLDFRDAGNATIATVTQNVDDAWPGTTDWFQVTLNGIAPAGTAFVRTAAMMVDGVFVDANPQSAFVDDFSLVPEPTAALMLLVPGLVLLRRR